MEINTDVFIIGGGAAGLTAAIYAARAGLDTVLSETSAVGGQLSSINKIENYPSYSDVSGIELSDNMKEQAIKSGAQINEFDETTKVNLTDNKKTVTTSEAVYNAKSVIIASGSSVIPLNVAGEEKMRGNGVHYCATCDGAMYKNKTVAVIGGGNSAVSAAIYLSSIAAKVIMIRRKNSFHCENILIDRLKSIENIKILYNWDLTGLIGDNRVIAAEIKNTRSNTSSIIPIDGVFAYIGYKPNTGIFTDYISVDENGYIIADDELKTNVFGVFAAGDVRTKEYRQITTAVSDGTIAALNAEKIVNGKIKL